MPSLEDKKLQEEARVLWTTFIGKVLKNGVEGVSDEEAKRMGEYLAQVRSKRTAEILKKKSAGVNPTLLGQLKGLRDDSV